MYRRNNVDLPRPSRLNENNHEPTHRRQRPTVLDQFKSAWLSAIIGCIMLSAGMWLLFWNEGRAVNTSRSLEEAIRTIIHLPTPSVVRPENEERLVHLTGVLDISEPLTEPEYGVSIPAVKLKRRVQMYQWVELEYPGETLDGGQHHSEASYAYSTEWRDKFVDSSRFYIRTGHHNPKEFPMKSVVYVSEHVTVGSFVLGESLKEKVSDFVTVTSDERPERRDIKLHSELYYHSQDVWNPEVGDIRVQFSYAGKTGDPVSIVAVQKGNKLEPYVSSLGKQVLMLRSGYYTIQDLFLVEHGQNWQLTWALRGIGWLILFLGANCSTSIIRLLVSRYSLLYDIMVLGIGSIDMALSISLSLLVIAFAWVWYRPVLGLSLVITAVLPFIWSAIQIYRTDSQETRYRRL